MSAEQARGGDADDSRAAIEEHGGGTCIASTVSCYTLTTALPCHELHSRLRRRHVLGATPLAASVCCLSGSGTVCPFSEADPLAGKGGLVGCELSLCHCTAGSPEQCRSPCGITIIGIYVCA